MPYLRSTAVVSTGCDQAVAGARAVGVIGLSSVIGLSIGLVPVLVLLSTGATVD